MKTDLNRANATLGGRQVNGVPLKFLVGRPPVVLKVLQSLHTLSEMLFEGLQV